MTTYTDLTIPFGSWANVHQSYNLSCGEELVVQNKSNVPLLLYVNSNSPADNSGIYVTGNDFGLLKITPTNVQYLFAKAVGTANGKLGVQR